MAVEALGTGSRAKVAPWNDPVIRGWVFQIVIFFLVLFHMINGLRIIILDLWPRLIEHQREAIWLEWMVFIPIYGMAVFVIVRTALGG